MHLAVFFNRYMESARTFYINERHAGCAAVSGWIAIFDDFYRSNPTCTFEENVAYPFFAYLPNNIGGKWQSGGV
jgi:hypothetical protein